MLAEEKLREERLLHVARVEGDRVDLVRRRAHDERAAVRPLARERHTRDDREAVRRAEHVERGQQHEVCTLAVEQRTGFVRLDEGGLGDDARCAERVRQGGGRGAGPDGEAHGYFVLTRRFSWMRAALPRRPRR